MRVWIESVPNYLSSQQLFFHLYTTSSIYKESSRLCYQRKPQIGSAVEMCNLVALCILNTTVLYSGCSPTVYASYPPSPAPIDDAVHSYIFCLEASNWEKVSFLLSSFWQWPLPCSHADSMTSLPASVVVRLRCY